MMEYPHSQEEYYDGMLRGFLQFAESQIRIVELFDHGIDKLDNYRRSKDMLDQFYNLVARIQMDGLLNNPRKEMSKKALMLLTEITKLEVDKLLKNFILN